MQGELPLLLGEGDMASVLTCFQSTGEFLSGVTERDINK
jgi:hypothetical protein